MEKINNLDPFYAPWVVRNAHIQTMYPVFFRSINTYRGIHERMDTPDGDFVDVVYTKNFFHSNLKKSPIVFLFHGLEGNITSKYASSLMVRFEDIGYRVVFMHHRNCSREANQKQVSYHGAFIDDITWIIFKMHKKYRSSPKFAVGFSIGGSMLLNYLIKKVKNPLSGAVVVSVPYDLKETVLAIERGFSKIYSIYLLRKLIQSTIKKIHAGILPVQCERKLREIKSIIEYDNLCTAPLHGYRDAFDYYAQASTKYRLSEIKTPTLAIHAMDDPFMTPSVIPHKDMLSKNVYLEISENGGHVGFLGIRNGRYEYWLDYAIPYFFSSFII